MYVNLDFFNIISVIKNFQKKCSDLISFNIHNWSWASNSLMYWIALFRILTLDMRLLRNEIEGTVSLSSWKAVFIAFTRFLSRSFRFSIANENFWFMQLPFKQIPVKSVTSNLCVKIFEWFRLYLLPFRNIFNQKANCSVNTFWIF